VTVCDGEPVRDCVGESEPVIVSDGEIVGVIDCVGEIVPVAVGVFVWVSEGDID
jgi:hypothetical protein